MNPYNVEQTTHLFQKMDDGGYLEQYLDQRLNELIKSPSLRNKRLIVGLADFFRAQERLDHFLAHIRRKIDTFLCILPTY